MRTPPTKCCRITLAVLGAAALVGLVGTLGTVAPPARAAATFDVSITSLAFVPAVITVTVGDDVRWTNNDSVQHTTTSTTGRWDSGRLDPGASFTVVFTQTGTFRYICTIHPLVLGTVVVGPPTATPTATTDPYPYPYPYPYPSPSSTPGPPTATSRPTNTSTPVGTAVPSATATKTPRLGRPTEAPVLYRVCPRMKKIIPAVVQQDALANPHRYAGYGVRMNPNVPPGPFNPLRSWLTLLDKGKPWSPVNGATWKAGCD